MPQNVLPMTKTGSTNAQVSSEFAAFDFEAYGEILKARYEAKSKERAEKQALKEIPIPAFTSDDPTWQETDKNWDSMLETERARIFKQYGEISKRDIYLVLKAEEEIRQCEGCTGLPCRKKINQFFIPQINYNSGGKYITIPTVDCKHERSRKLQRQIERMSGLSKIPPEYQGKTFADYKVDAANSYAVEVAKALIDKPNNGAYFFGGVGTGKTFLAAILAQEIIKHGRQVIFATVPNISKQIRSTFNGKSETTEAAILEKLETVPTLILDDVGIEKPTRFVCSTLCNLFNERYNARLQTIITSNLRLKELEYIFNHPTDDKETLDGTRIYDRCKTMCAPVEFKGASRR